MALRKPPPPPPERAAAGTVSAPKVEKTALARGKTRIFARLRWHHRRGTSVTVPFGAPAALSGRLLDADGAGLAGRWIRVVARPSRGAVAPVRAETVRTGEHGGFRLDLPAGPSAPDRRRPSGATNGWSGRGARRSRSGCAAASSSTRPPTR